MVAGPALAATSDPLYDFVKKRAGAKRAATYTTLIRAKADKYKVPPMLVANIIEHESHFDPRCRTGPSMGLMQVNYGHARRGHNLYDPATNIDYGCKILREYHQWAKERLPKSANSRRVWEYALTAYNWGPTRAVSRGLYRSRYSDKVLRTWRLPTPGTSAQIGGGTMTDAGNKSSVGAKSSTETSAKSSTGK